MRTWALSVQTDLTNLQSELTPPTSTTSSSLHSFARTVTKDINKTEGQVEQLVGSATPPTGSITQKTLNQALQQVQSLQTFNMAYLNAVQSDLLAAGTTNPSSNATAFDNAVTTAITNLNTVLTTGATLVRHPRVDHLDSEHDDHHRYVEPADQRVEDRAAAEHQRLRVVLFGLESVVTITQGETQLTHDIASAAATYNESL